MADDSLGSKGILKVEFVTLIAEALHSLGYERTLSSLESESNIPLSSSPVFRLNQLILDGNWEESLRSLKEIPHVPESAVKSASFLILEQKFLKLLGELEALTTLREEIAPLSINYDRIRELASLLLNSSSGDDKIKPKSNPEVLQDVQKMFPPNVLIPQGRLLQLLEQAVESQRKSCRFHNSLTHSLFSDHYCGKTQIPCQTLQTLKEHQDEVSCVRFSHNGQLLASCSKDKSVIIWEFSPVGKLELKHRLEGHEVPVCCVSWSPNDEQVLTCGAEEVVRRWDVNSGACASVYSNVNRGTISCAWSPDGERVYAVLTTRTVMSWHLDGTASDSWMRRGPPDLKFSDLEITSDGRLIISLQDKITIAIADREVQGPPRLIVENADVVSFVLSGDGKFLLVSLLNRGIHLWSIEGEMRLVAKYIGRECSSSVVRACFGGVSEAFIASGSEDSRVFIWHRETGELLQTLGGHSGSVNSITWNPKNPHMLASGSSVGFIRIWGLDPN